MAFPYAVGRGASSQLCPMWRRTLVGLGGLSLFLGANWIGAVIAVEPTTKDDPPKQGAPQDTESPAVTIPGESAPLVKLRADLEARLSNAVLTGNFTVTGQDQQAPATERYELANVRHLGNDKWLFQVRIRYGEHDVSLPLTLPIRWAGDTPVITVDSLGIPGLGVYTARVMIYRDHYAGFWTGEDHGGHLFGVVRKGEAAAPSDGDAPAP